MTKTQIRTLIFLMTFSSLCSAILNPATCMAQTSVFSNKPKSDPNDDERLCKGEKPPLANDKYCTFYRGYMNSLGTDNAKAEGYRNQMLDLLKVQIDEYYDGNKNGRVKDSKRFQFLLDVLGIGLAFTGNIVGGLRSKTVMAATSGAFQAGRNSLNERFDLLKQQILVNKMNANRTNQWAQIVLKKSDGVGVFSWDDAKAEAQQYLFRGSFEDALDSLVEDTGAQAQAAQTNLQNVLKAVSQNVLTAKLTNFNDYIVPMNKAAIKLDADIVTKQGEIDAAMLAAGIAVGAPLPNPVPPAIAAKIAEKTDLETKKANLLENYKNILTAIKVGGDFESIDQKIRAKYPAGVIAFYDQYLNNFKATPPTITSDQYDFILTKINAVVGEDEELNKRFLDVLKNYKLQ